MTWHGARWRLTGDQQVGTEPRRQRHHAARADDRLAGIGASVAVHVQHHLDIDGHESTAWHDAGRDEVVGGYVAGIGQRVADAERCTSGDQQVLTGRQRERLKRCHGGIDGVGSQSHRQTTGGIDERPGRRVADHRGCGRRRCLCDAPEEQQTDGDWEQLAQQTGQHGVM